MPANLEERVTAGMRFGHLSAVSPTRQLYGVEVELENVTSADGLNGWATHPDGSLRNHGMEFVTEPVSAEGMSVRLENLYGCKRTNGWVTSVRTGIHVHADMRLKTMEQMRRLLACYVLSEASLFSYVGRERESSIFCVPYYLSSHGLQAFARYLRRGGDTVRLLHETHKYSALNLSSLTRLGTVEFRQSPTWDTLTPALVWTGLIDSLVENSANISVESALRMADTDYRGFLRTVYGTQERSLGGIAVENDSDDLVKEYLLLPCTYNAAAAWPKADCSGTPSLKKSAVPTPRPRRATYDPNQLVTMAQLYGGGGAGGTARRNPGDRVVLRQPQPVVYDTTAFWAEPDQVRAVLDDHIPEYVEPEHYDDDDDDDYEPEEPEELEEDR